MVAPYQHKSKAQLAAELAACQQELQALQQQLEKQQQLQQQHQSELAILRELFTTFNNNVPVSIFLKDLNGCFRMANRCFCEWHNLSSAQEIIGKRSSDLFPPENAKALMAMDERVLNGNQVIRQELKLDFIDGNQRTLDVVKFPVFDNDGQMVGLGSLSIDISDKKRTEQALLENQQRFKDFAEIASDWLWETDANLRFIWLSESLERVMGIKREWFYGKTREEIGVTEDIDPVQWQQHLAKEAAHQPFRNFEYRRSGPTGEHWVRVSGTPIFDQQGQFQGHRGVGTDITEIHEARQRADQAQKRLSDAIDVFSGAFALFDPDDCLVIYNRRYRNFFTGIALQIGVKFHDIVRERVERGLIAPAIGNEEAWLAERFRDFRHPKGTFDLEQSDGIWLQINEERVQDGSLLYTAVDITERKHMEQALQKSHDQLEQRVRYRTAELQRLNQMMRQIIDSVPHMIFSKSRDSKFLLVNRTTADIYGTEPSQLEGQYQRNTYLSPEIVELYHSIDCDVVDNDYVYHDIDQKIYDAQGQPHYFNVTATRLMMAEPAEAAVLVVGIEMTERKQMEEKLMRQERLATLGQLTATVSHELRNPLGTMRNSVGLLKRLATKQQPIPKDLLDTIDRTVSRCDNIISDLLDFTRLRPLEPTLTRIDDWLEKALNEYVVPEHIELQRHFSAAAEIVFDHDRLRQALINVLDNACQAMAPETDVDDVGQSVSNAQLVIISQLTQQRLEIVVQDNGPGITLEHQSKVFEPLFSTKNFGVGLGLVIVRQIMQQHHGDIEISSKPGQGTRITLWLPLAEN